MLISFVDTIISLKSGFTTNWGTMALLFTFLICRCVVIWPIYSTDHGLESCYSQWTDWQYWWTLVDLANPPAKPLPLLWTDASSAALEPLTQSSSSQSADTLVLQGCRVPCMKIFSNPLVPISAVCHKGSPILVVQRIAQGLQYTANCY